MTPPCEQQREIDLLAEMKTEKRRKEEKEKRRKELIEKSKQIIRDQAKKLGWRLTQTSSGKFVAAKPYSNDKIDIEITKTGVLKTITDKISMPNHENAEAFLRNISSRLNQKWKIFHRHGTGAAHTHTHIHTH